METRPLGAPFLPSTRRTVIWSRVPTAVEETVYCPDAAMARAAEAGARVVTEAATNAWGARGGRVRDPLGNIWWVTAQLETVSAEDSWARLSEPGYAAAMREAQETLDVELAGLPTGRASAPIAPAQPRPAQP